MMVRINAICKSRAGSTIPGDMCHMFNNFRSKDILIVSHSAGKVGEAHFVGFFYVGLVFRIVR